MRRQTGFTLIELIMVIVILGVLAATAAPRFSNLRVEADGAVLKGIRGSMESAVSMAHGIWLAKNLAPASNVLFTNNVTISMVNGYPAQTRVGILAALDLPSGVYQMDDVSGTLYKSMIGISLGCELSYLNATALNTPPVISGPIYAGC